MTDERIIQFYFERNEEAITASELVYGAFCRYLAMNILQNREDAEECVNDTWLSAWRRIPPTVPKHLKAFFGKLTRDLSIDLWRRNHAKKRYDGIELMLSELEDCVSSALNVEQQIEAEELTELINLWLDGLPADARTCFIRRYWYGDSVQDLAKRFHCSSNQMAQRLRRLRIRLRQKLEDEEVSI